MHTPTADEQAKANHINATFQTLLAKLPKSFDLSRVTLKSVPLSEQARSLRVFLDGSLLEDYAFTFNFGWMPYESSVGNGKDGERVRRAMRSAMKAHPHK